MVESIVRRGRERERERERELGAASSFDCRLVYWSDKALKFTERTRKLTKHHPPSHSPSTGGTRKSRAFVRARSCVVFLGVLSNAVPSTTTTGASVTSSVCRGRFSFAIRRVLYLIRFIVFTCICFMYVHPTPTHPLHSLLAQKNKKIYAHKQHPESESPRNFQLGAPLIVIKARNKSIPYRHRPICCCCCCVLLLPPFSFLLLPLPVCRARGDDEEEEEEGDDDDDDDNDDDDDDDERGRRGVRGDFGCCCCCCCCVERASRLLLPETGRARGDDGRDEGGFVEENLLLLRLLKSSFFIFGGGLSGVFETTRRARNCP